MSVILLPGADFYAAPVATTAGDLAKLQQPIIGEEGFNPKRKVESQVLPSPTDVTFGLNIEVPAGMTHFVSSVVFGVLGNPTGAFLPDAVAQVGELWEGQWYAHPHGLESRRAKRIKTFTFAAGWGYDVTFDGNSVITFTIDPAYPVTFARALFSAAPT